MRLRLSPGGLAVVLAAVLLCAGPVVAFDPLNGDFSKDNPLDVRIVTYNTQANFISDPGADPEFNRILIALNPDLICFQEISDSLSSTVIRNRLDSVLPNGSTSWQIHLGLSTGSRTVLASRYALSLTRTDTIPISSTRGVTIALADLPGADYPTDLYFLGVHLKCCGSASDDQKRQRSVDAMANWMGDARGVMRPSGDNVVLAPNTPMIALGDFNMVGDPQQEVTILTGDIQDEVTFGPDVHGDWDDSDLTDEHPLDPFTGDDFTWQGNGSFPPGRLDRLFFADSVMVVANSFILNTDTMTPAALEAAGLQAGDTLPANSSDHLPVVMDVRLAVDLCPDDPDKTDPGVCGCGVPDDDSDGDMTPDCTDGCPNDPNKTAAGICGCGIPDDDSDGDLTPDCLDGCPADPGKIDPGVCGCGVADDDSDGDMTPDCIDGCPNDPNKTAAGICGCGIPDDDSDGDLTPDCLDGCPADPGKIDPGVCGCGVADDDSDGDMTPDCIDGCPADPDKIAPGPCGCGVADTDADGDLTPDCLDDCPDEPALIVPEGPTELVCDDAIDNDCDALTDGADADCIGDCPLTCGDVNGDVEVNLQDFATFALCFGGSPLNSQGCACSDLNTDGAINLQDFATFSLVFGSGSSNTAPNCP